MAKRNKSVVCGSVDVNENMVNVENHNLLEENAMTIENIEQIEQPEQIEQTEVTEVTKETKVKVKRGPQVPVKEFLRVWQTSSSLQEVATTLNMKPQSVYIRVLSYKKKGINLKDMPKGTFGAKKLDADELNKFLEELNS